MAGRFSLEAVFSARDKMHGVIGRIEGRMSRFSRVVGGGIMGVGQATRAMESRIVGAANTMGRAGMAMGRGMAVGGTLGVAALTGVAMAADNLSERADNLLVRSTTLGFPIEALQEWQFASEQAGQATEDFDKSLGFFAKNLGAAKFGTGALAATLGKANPQLLGQLKATENIGDAFELYIDSLRKVEDPTKRAALATGAFGKSGLGMLTLVEQSKDALASLRAEQRANGIMTLEQAQAAEAFGDSLTSLKRSVGGFVQGALLPLMPHLDAGVRGMREWVLANREPIGTKLASFIGDLRTGLPPVIARVREIGAVIGTEVVGPLTQWARANEGLIRARVGDFFDDLVPRLRAFAGGAREGLREVRAFAGGVVDGLAMMKPVADGALATLGHFFSSESTSKAQALGEVVVKLGGAMVGLSIATRAAAVVGFAWTAITKTAAIVSVGWGLAVRAVRSAIISYEIATKAGVGATIAMSFASKAAAADMMVTRTAAFAAAGGFKAMALSAGAAAAAVGAVMVAVAANDELKKNTGGLGIFDIAGGMIEQGTIDPFKVVDAHMNEQARRAAKKPSTGVDDALDLASLDRMLAGIQTGPHSMPSLPEPQFIGAALDGRGLLGGDVGTRPGSDGDASPPRTQPTPVPSSPRGPEEGLAHQIAQELAAVLKQDRAEDKVTIEVKAKPGTEAEVKKPKAGLKTPIKLPNSGAL
jgi:hypothetical protein